MFLKSTLLILLETVYTCECHFCKSIIYNFQEFSYSKCDLLYLKAKLGKYFFIFIKLSIKICKHFTIQNLVTVLHLKLKRSHKNLLILSILLTKLKWQHFPKYSFFSGFSWQYLIEWNHFAKDIFLIRLLIVFGWNKIWF